MKAIHLRLSMNALSKALRRVRKPRCSSFLFIAISFRRFSLSFALHAHHVQARLVWRMVNRMLLTECTVRSDIGRSLFGKLSRYSQRWRGFRTPCIVSLSTTSWFISIMTRTTTRAGQVAEVTSDGPVGKRCPKNAQWSDRETKICYTRLVRKGIRVNEQPKRYCSLNFPKVS